MYMQHALKSALSYLYGHFFGDNFEELAFFESVRRKSGPETVDPYDRTRVELIGIFEQCPPSAK